MIQPVSRTTRFKYLLQARRQNAEMIGRALRLRRRFKPDFDDVEAYCMFIGYPRSGHTLIKALLNAHKNIMLAQELNALRYVQWHVSRDMLYSLLIARDQWFADMGRTWDEYSYNVPNQWQGRYEKLRVIGDKRAGRSAEILTEQPDLLVKLQQTVRVPVKIIHIVRNPFDNISTIHRKHNLTLAQSIDSFFANCHTNAAIMQQSSDKIAILTIRLEAFIDDPAASLTEMGAFLGVAPYGSYLEDCAGLVFRSPNQSRHRITWSNAVIADVTARSHEYAFLDGYDFET
ncbi:MAG: sulfotransferase [Anaerolineae bacterium]|nr:sulfotransferase [Anaerolineae bacterium]